MDDSIHLRLLIGAKVPRAVPRSMVDAFTRLRVTSAADSASGFQLTFTLGKSSELHTMLSTGDLNPPTRVIAAVVWRATTTVLIDGVVMRQDVAADTLTLTGDDLTAVMDLDHRVHLYDGIDLDQQVQQICGRYASYGISTRIDKPPRPDSPNPRDRSATQRGTDLAYIRGLAATVGYAFYLRPGPDIGSSTAYWGPQRRTGQPQPALSMNFDTASTVDSLTFAVDGRRKVQYLDRTGTAINPPDLPTLRPNLAARPTKALRTEPLPPTAMLDDTQTILLGGSVSAATADTVTGSGELDVRRYGRILRDRRLVAVRGAGESCDGTYYVTSVTHNLAPGSFRQSFQLARGGLGALSRTVRL